MDIPTELQRFIKKCLADKELFKIKFNKEYVSKIDVYSLGISFIEMIFRISQKTSIKNYNYFNEFLTTVIIPMIHIDPDKRYNASEALDNLNILLKKYNVTQSKSKSPKLPTEN